MIKEPFYINLRFFIDPSCNRVIDKTENKETRVEPRIMELLCLLSAHAGNTITREEIVTTIWKDYGGGDEALTQAISAIRKLLSDTNKKLIQTLPKKGYCFNVTISYVEEKPKPTNNKRQFAYITLAAVFVIGLFLFLSFSKRTDSKVPSLPYTETEFPGNDPDGTNEENEKNTIVTTGPDKRTYRLVMIGDRPPKFYINDTILPVNQWDPYMPLINNLKRQLQDKN